MTTPLRLRICLHVVRAIRPIVPSRLRALWLQEWEAELRHHTGAGRRHSMSHILGPVADALWLRQQSTADLALIQDIRYALRQLRERPGFSLMAVLILALGIGATTAIFSIIDAVLLRTPPFPEPERIVTVWQTDPSTGNQRAEVAPGNFLDWRERSRTLEGLAAIEPWSFDYTGGDEPEVFFASLVSESFFDALGISAAHGRTFLASDHEVGRSGAVVMTDGLWRQRFAADPGIIGRALTLDDEPHTVVGVLPRGFELGMDPAGGERGMFAPKVFAEYDTRTRGGGWWQVIGRLRPGVTVADAQAEMDIVAAQLGDEYPRTNTDVGARVVPLHEWQVADLRPALLLLSGAVFLVLLIACANVANLLLARGVQRQQEFAIRGALGADRVRLLRQLLTESLVIALVGAAGGVALAAWSVDFIVALSPGEVPRMDAVGINGRVLCFALVITVVTAVLFGLAPAIQSLLVDLHGPLKQGRRTGSGTIHHRLRGGLVAVEVAMALVLLVGAGLLLRSFGRLVSVDPGFSPRNTIALQVFAWDRHDTAGERAVFFQETVDRIASLPGIQAVGAVSSFPLGLADVTIESTLAIRNRAAPPPGEEPQVAVSIATPDYFRAMGIPLQRGRGFETRDDAESPAVALINETLARRHWPDEDPLAQTIAVQWQGDTVDAAIVGVVGQARHAGLDRAPRAELFLPHAQRPFGSMTYVVRTLGDPGSLAQAIKEEVWAVDSLQTFYSTSTVEQLMAGSLSAQRFGLALLGTFAVVALVLAALGIYGVISFATRQRTHEIGIRVALGAHGSDIVRMVVRHGLALAAVGVVIGLGGAIALTRFLESQLFEVSPTDPVTLFAVCMLLGIVAVSACYFPARRASRIDPLIALRSE